MDTSAAPKNSAKLSLPYVELNTFLKLMKIANTGGEAKHLIRSRNIFVDGVIETRNRRKLLAGIGDIGHRIDTSELGAKALRAWVKDFIRVDCSRLTLLFQSFGYKNGIPLDADLVCDVRCLPNPHYDPELRPLTGRDEAVIRFMKRPPAAQRMYDDIRNFIAGWLPFYIADNRSYLTAAIGCTGGQHRSVYLAEKLARHFEPQQQVLLRHRELD